MVRTECSEHREFLLNIAVWSGLTFNLGYIVDLLYHVTVLLNDRMEVSLQFLITPAIKISKMVKSKPLEFQRFRISTLREFAII